MHWAASCTLCPQGWRVFIFFVVICFAVGFALLWIVVIKPAQERAKREALRDVIPSADEDSSIENPPDSGPRSSLD
jgi:hypothetical protein